MSCYDLLVFTKKICCQCFRSNNRSKPQDIQQSMIQMTESRSKELNNKATVSQQPKIIQKNHQKKNSFKEKQMNTENSVKTPAFEEQFHSIDSSYHFQSQRSKASIRVSGTLDKIPRSIKQIKVKQKKKSQLYISNQWQDTPILQNLNLQNQIQQVKDWFKKEYGAARLASFRVNHAVRLRMQGYGMLTLLAHKLQDFKIKFQGQNSQVTSKLCNKSKTLIFQHIMDQTGQSSFKNSKLQQYYEIISNASTLHQIIRSLISKEAMRILHGLKSIQSVNCEGDNLRITFPILQIKMNSLMAKQQKLFHLASQMGESNQQKQQQRQIVFVSYSLDQTEENWQSVIRVFFGIISRIEIYSQTYIDRYSKTQQYFKKRFSQLQSHLQGLRIIAP